jgi:hypothetical protein
MNQGPRYVRLMEKSRGQKSRATVPLSTLNGQSIKVSSFLLTKIFFVYIRQAGQGLWQGLQVWNPNMKHKHTQRS